MVKPIKQVLMQRDGVSEEDAEQQIHQAREDAMERLAEGEMPFDICEEYFGLEPDYLEKLLMS